jgi:hypothetical protein
MAWTYDPTQIATSTLFQTRWLIGDILSKDPQFQDEELLWAMTQRTSIYGVAADACRAIASRLSREADSSQGNFRTAYSERARNYRAMAGTYEIQAAVRSGGMPYSGQLSQADYDIARSNPDTMRPAFAIGMMTNYLPIGPIDTELSPRGE